MYTTYPTSEKVELWTSDIDGGNKVKIATRETQEGGLVYTLNWAPDNFHLSFFSGVQTLRGRDRWQQSS